MTWLVIIAVGLGSFVFRVGPLLLLQRVSLSERSDRAIRHASLAAITALIVVSVRHSATGEATVPTVLAVALGVVLAVRGASMLRLLVCGAATYAAAVVVVDLLAR